MKHLDSVLKLIEAADDTEDIIAVHGTSLEAVMHLAEHGVLPYSGRHPGLFYVYGVKGQKTGFEDRSFSLSEAVAQAETYSEWNARKHYLAEKIKAKGFEPAPEQSDKFHEELCDYIESRDFGTVEELPVLKGLIEQKLFTEKQLMKWSTEAFDKQRKGVILYISAKALDKFTFEKVPSFECSDDELRIAVPQGFPIDCISGIEPRGQYEWNFLQKLTQEAA